MKIHKEFPLKINNKKAVCPICRTSKKKPCVYVGYIKNEESMQIDGLKAVHVDCIDLVIAPSNARGYKNLYQMFVG